ncbi:MAG: 4'-phosphopantetheinyl transferase superfamily protein [Clostridia bacterium]|nr:4'-phosphopantetheinyl transferase superfamily protein [Clostridia bacterium]
MEIYAAMLGERLEESEFQMLLKYLPDEKQARIKRFRRWEDAQRALIAEILIRDTVCSKLNVHNRDITFGTNEFGKPFLKGYEGFSFNVSHSGKWVVGGFDSKPLGIDVEQIHNIDLAIAKRFFSKQEYLDLNNKPENEKLSYFFDLWTLKESYIKADGRGLNMPLDSFSMKREGLNFLVETENPLKNCFFKQYDIDPEYKLSVCALSNEFPQNVMILKEQELWDRFINKM